MASCFHFTVRRDSNQLQCPDNTVSRQQPFNCDVILNNVMSLLTMAVVLATEYGNVPGLPVLPVARVHSRVISLSKKSQNVKNQGPKKLFCITWTNKQTKHC